MIVVVTKPIVQNKNYKINNFCSYQNCFPKQKCKTNQKQLTIKNYKIHNFWFCNKCSKNKNYKFYNFCTQKHSKTMYQTYRVVKMQVYILILYNRNSRTPQFYYVLS